MQILNLIQFIFYSKYGTPNTWLKCVRYANCTNGHGFKKGLTKMIQVSTTENFSYTKF